MEDTTKPRLLGIHMSDRNARCREHILDTIPARLACYDAERRLLWINRHSARLLGKTPEQLLGQTCCEIWQKCAQPFKECHLIRAIRTGEPQEAEIETPQGRIWSLAAFPCSDEEGKIAFISEYGHDVTAAKRLSALEDEINAITRHDLKTPAIATLSIVRLMKSADNLTEDQHDLLEELERSGTQMLEIINQTHTLRRIEQGKYEPELRPVDCVAVTRDVRSYFRQQCSARNADIRILLNGTDADDRTACFVPAEENLLRTALMNLVKNACEASPSESDVLIEIECGQPKTIRVRNKGAVPRTVRDDFFGKYVTCGKKGGTGLGTYSALRMIQAQNATICMRTTDENGGETEVCILFNLPSEKNGD